MLFKEIIAVCSENHVKPIKNIADLTTVEASGIYHWVSREAQSVQCIATGWTTGRSRFDPRLR
jgi:hypothetical protein